jgi:hypothetical protein
MAGVPGAAQALAVANQALRATQAVGFPIEKGLVDNTPIGSTWVRLGQAIAMTATSIAIKLPRNPTFFWWTTNNGAVVYQTAGDVTASTGALFVCRATASTTANLVVF